MNAKRCLIVSVLAVLVSPALFAQGRGGAEWTTASGDAQRTGWVRTDNRISVATMSKPGFQFLWKLKAEHLAPAQLQAFTQPVHLDRIVGFRGFKSILTFGSSSDTVYAIDDDPGRMMWWTHINYSGDAPQPEPTAACPGGITAAPSRPTPIAPGAAGAAGGGRRGGSTGSAVGEPGRGAVTLAQAGQGRAGAAAPPAAAGRAGGAGAGGAAPAPGGGGGGRGPIDPLVTQDAFYVVASDGFLHGLNVQDGTDVAARLKFLPNNAKASALLVADNVIYTSTSNGCGAAPNGVWALNWGSEKKDVAMWKADGNVAGSAGIALGSDGTAYASIGEPASQIVALEPKTLRLKAAFAQPKADFNATPVVFPFKGKDLVAATGSDGKLYVVDATTMKLVASAPYSAPGFASGALATWEANGTRWILAPAGSGPASAKFPAGNGAVTNGAVVAFKLSDATGTMTLEPGWMSRDLLAPLPPVVINGVVFALSSGEFRTADEKVTVAQRAQRSQPAVLYALDATTGKELWTSGRTITSFVPRTGFGTGNSQVSVLTYDGTVYAFGFPIEK